MILLPESELPKASILAERLCDMVRKRPLKTAGGRLPLPLSIGVAEARLNQPDMIMKRADDGLYLAKARGRNQAASASEESPAGYGTAAE